MILKGVVGAREYKSSVMNSAEVVHQPDELFSADTTVEELSGDDSASSSSHRTVKIVIAACQSLLKAMPSSDPSGSSGEGAGLLGDPIEVRGVCDIKVRLFIIDRVIVVVLEVGSLLCLRILSICILRLLLFDRGPSCLQLQ